MTGAASLCAGAALRSGAGLVTLALPAGEQRAAARLGRPELMTLPLPAAPGGTAGRRAVAVILRFLEKRKVSALAVGPGLRVTRDTVFLVKELLRRVKVPVVLDADGLNALAASGRPARAAGPLAITPHPGEAARLLKTSVGRVQADRPAAARRLARSGAVAVLKGEGTLIADRARMFRNPTGNPGLAKGGAGDILTGVAAALVGQVRGATPAERLWRACLSGVFLHGLAADLAARRKTRIGLLAGDVVEALPAAFRNVYGPKI
jgi:hydroxyethylthiazole kinase-like uncharacterized protein yjeF